MPQVSRKLEKKRSSNFEHPQFLTYSHGMMAVDSMILVIKERGTVADKQRRQFYYNTSDLNLTVPTTFYSRLHI